MRCYQPGPGAWSDHEINAGAFGDKRLGQRLRVNGGVKTGHWAAQKSATLAI